MNPEGRFRLDEKVAIVTGGAGALGRVIARGLAEARARVALASRNGESAEEAAGALREDGFTAVGIQVDVSDRESAVAMQIGSSPSSVRSISWSTTQASWRRSHNSTCWTCPLSGWRKYSG
jgi:NADP-dependent 3-hydroxy acid dehydrogenase YdfG